MSERDEYRLILASLHRAMLDDAHWPTASGLIDEACGAEGNVLFVGEGSHERVRAHLVGLYYRGERNEELGREYMEHYHAIDEAVPRLRQMAYGDLVRRADLYTREELRTSVAFNDFHRRSRFQDGLGVRIEGPQGCSHITWAIGEPVGRGDGFSSSQIAMFRRTAPHVRQLVCVRQALAEAGALGRSLAGLLDARGLGVIHLDRRRRIVAANDRAREVLRCCSCLSDRGGVLHASDPAGRARLEQLLASVLPRPGSVSVGGSMALSRPCGHRWFVIYVKPTVAGEIDFGGGRVAALVLIVDPWRTPGIDPRQVATALGLTRVESEVASRLAEGKTVREIAAMTGRKERTIRWHVEQVYAKCGISRQADLVRLVLSIAHLG